MAFVDPRLSSAEARAYIEAAPANDAPVAVVDIGSNSVRLVIYDGPWRRAYALHNEKTICAIGRNMVRTGHLDPAGKALALATLARCRLVCEGHGVRSYEAVATAAARDADDGAAFVAEAEKLLGTKIRILTGEDEARIAAEGVLAGIPGADGVVADLGGGSLDIVLVHDGRTDTADTLPYGPLRLMDISDGNLSKARNAVAKGLAKSKFGKTLNGRALYAVGGIWRALARVDMDYEDYPLQVLHNYAIPASRALKLCKVVSGLSRKSLDKMKAVPKRRAEALPYGALVLEQMIQSFALKEVVISAYGLREGLLFRRLSRGESAKDPLIEFARDWNLRESRTPGHAEELFDWMTPLFPDEPASARRVRLAACLLSDIGWRRHPDDRAQGAYQQVLRGAYAGADHRERAIMASASYYRYAGNGNFPKEAGAAHLLGPEGARVALKIGLAERVAYAISGALSGELSTMPLRLAGGTLALEFPRNRTALQSEGIAKRLNDLAKILDLKSELTVA